MDIGPTDPPSAFNFGDYLQFLQKYGHNFIRLWTWELTTWNTTANRERSPKSHWARPHPWKRTGPGNALDGQPKFDLARFDEEYFQRLHNRVKLAAEHGIYVSIMLFEGWGLQFCPNAYESHPFHPDNNINGIRGDLDGDGRALEIHELRDPRILEIQKAYVRHVIDTVNQFDNVLYEISNENHPASTEWQYEMIRFIKEYQKQKPKQHPVGMTFQYRGGSNKTLFDSPADWISPNPEGGYRDDPPPADGRKVIINDTDHLWGIGGNRTWVWKSFMRGMHPIFMDPYKGEVLSGGANLEWTEDIRQAMGDVRRWSERVNLARLVPRPELSTTKYCLADPGNEYLIFFTEDISKASLNLASARYTVTWFDTRERVESSGEVLAVSSPQVEITVPQKGEWLLHLKAVR